MSDDLKSKTPRPERHLRNRFHDAEPSNAQQVN